MKKGLSKYLTPLILSNLLINQNINYKITLSFIGWAKKFEMVNNNYPFIKYNQEKSSEYLNINEKIVFDYFERLDECMKYQLEKCLTILSNKQLNLIELDRVTMVRKSNITAEQNENSGLDIMCNPPINEVITDEDRKFVIDCEAEAELMAGISRQQDKYFGIKSIIYNQHLRKLLSERNILFTYSAYNIFCKNKHLVEQALSNFETDIDEQSFIQEFYINFIEYTENKANIRQKQEIKKKEDKFIENNRDKNEDELDKKSKKKLNKLKNTPIKEYRLIESYVNDFRLLSELTILPDAEDFSENIDIDEKSILDKNYINLISY